MCVGSVHWGDVLNVKKILQCQELHMQLIRGDLIIFFYFSFVEYLKEKKIIKNKELKIIKIKGHEEGLGSLCLVLASAATGIQQKAACACGLAGQGSAEGQPFLRQEELYPHLVFLGNSLWCLSQM